MGDKTKTKMRIIGIWLRVKIKNLINSKPFIFLLGIIIGVTLLYTYTEGKKLFHDYNQAVVIYNAREISGNSRKSNSGDTSAITVSETTPHKVSGDSVNSLVEKYFGEEKEIALAVMKAESQGDPSRIGDKHLVYADGRYGMSCGLFQIRVLQGRPSCDELLDAEFNVKYAYEMYQKSGWHPWSAFKNESYKKYLN